MPTAATAVVAVLRLTGIIQLVLGLLFWSGNALALVPVHIRVGALVVLSLWILALLAARAGVSLTIVTLALAWGLVVPVIGLTQTRILPGDYHVVVQLIHLLLGVGAITLGERLYECLRAVAAQAGDGLAVPEAMPRR